jgi:hypothetical protein
MHLSGKIASALICIFFAVNISSCTITHSHRHDRGKHKGWFKNPKNPHNPGHKPGSNPGKGNGKNKKDK